MNEWMLKESIADLVSDLIARELRDCIKHGDKDPEYVDALTEAQIVLDNADTVFIVRPPEGGGTPRSNVIQFPNPEEIVIKNPNKVNGLAG